MILTCVIFQWQNVSIIGTLFDTFFDFFNNLIKRKKGYLKIKPTKLSTYSFRHKKLS